jgi:4-diphosphocytidyl-2-C-methyl-D-erythritol kinase
MKSEFAPAKVNLFLHVGALRADGFHPINSLMVFADIGDRLTASPAERFELTVEGPTRGHAPAGEDNLVLRAARALFTLAGVAAPALRITLDKQLPAEAGLGGGSSDAAATLRLLRSALDLAVDDNALQAVAASLGSDIPACLLARPVLARGRGEQLTPADGLPTLPGVLARPPVAASTAAVYRAFDQGAAPAIEAPDLPRGLDPRAAAAFLASCRNDLEAPAVALQPAIGEALDQLRAAPEALLARMSGSGSACFALCADAASADRLADRLAAEHSDWWVRSCHLGGSPA